MPKDSRKAKKAAAAAAAAAPTQEEDDDRSITSDNTVSTQQATDDENGLSEIESYENKVKEAMDLALEKSVQTRTNALKALTVALQKRVLTFFLLDRHLTMCDLVERSLKKGKGLEQSAAARLGMMLTVSLTHTDEVEEVYKILKPLLTVVANDPSAAVAARRDAAAALGLISYLACNDLAEVTNVMNALHNLFAKSLPKGNGELPVVSPEVAAFHTAALSGFCLLMTLLSPTTVYSMANKLLTEMSALLGSADVDLRIQAGEAVALIYEMTRIHDEDYMWNRHKEEELCSTLKELATDSHKFRAKKDRKSQRASFRDVLSAVEEGEATWESINVGPSYARQELLLDTWALRIQYSTLCQILGLGMSVHVTYNPGIRDIFGLGPPPLSMDTNNLKTKSKKTNHESPFVKARSLARNKYRDNRQEDKNYED